MAALLHLGFGETQVSQGAGMKIGMDRESAGCLQTPFGWIRLAARQGCLIGVDLSCYKAWPEIGQQHADPIIEAAVLQFGAYFEDARSPFTLPLARAGTPFQQRIWTALTQIPSGQTASYTSIAQQSGSGPRAVAAACKANPYPILVPCHRVLASNGLGGYCGEREGPMLAIKRWLLRHEGYLQPGPR